MSRSKAASAVAALSALVALLSLMKSVRPSAADLLQAMRQAGECRERGRHLARRHAEASGPQRWRPARSGRCAGRAASRCRRDRRRRRAGRSRARGRRARCRPRTSRAPRARCAETRSTQPRLASRRRSAMSRHQSSSSPMTGCAALRDQARLEAGVVLHGAVPVEVVGRDVEQHADAGRQRGRQLDLERRHLDHVDAILGRRLQIQDGGADVAAHLRVPPGRAQDVGDQRRGRRLAVGAGDGDERRIRGSSWPARGRTARRRR